MAAVGNVRADSGTSTAANAYLTIQPSSGEEWRLTNVYAGGAIEVYAYDGTNETLIVRDSGSIVSYNIPVSNTEYVRVKNVSGSTMNIGYSGFTTKEA